MLVYQKYQHYFLKISPKITILKFPTLLLSEGKCCIKGLTP